jgi:hypothetical protein
MRRHSRHAGCAAVTVRSYADVIDVTAVPDLVAVWAMRLGHSVITGGPEGRSVTRGDGGPDGRVPSCFTL